MLFRPSSGSWFVTSDNRWYEATEDSDIGALVSLLPVEVFDDNLVSTPGSVGGFVRVVDVDGAPELEFLSSLGEVVRRIANLIPGLLHATATWESGAYPDGWVETFATLRLDGARRCSITAFLPSLDGDIGPSAVGDKELAVVVTHGRHSEVDVHPLRRGDPTRIEVFRSRTAARGTLLTFQCSMPEPADDERALGFVVTRIETLA